MITISAANLHVGFVVKTQMGHRSKSKAHPSARSWTTAEWRLTEVKHGATVKVRGVMADGTEGDTEFYNENRVELIERADPA